jgi:COP9 signalosome complex subunit 6
MAASQQNPNMSTQKSDSGLHVALHPLVLLTISDYITRHTLRQQEGAIVGALMGQQNGREVTVEHAWEVKIWGGDAPMVDIEWFEHRLQQSEYVRKLPKAYY